MSEGSTSRVVAVARGVENAESEGPKRGSHHEALDVWIGRWINQGHMIEDDGRLGLTITASDVYERAPGGFFVLHTAYGRVGNFGDGGVEIIGFDDMAGDLDRRGHQLVVELRPTPTPHRPSLPQPERVP